MTISQLDKFIEDEHSRLVKRFGKDSNEKDRTLSRTVKLTEELGELSSEVLSYYGDQRPAKLGHRNQSLENEIADVIITTLLLAKNLNIDVWKALKTKINKIKKRKY